MRSHAGSVGGIALIAVLALPSLRAALESGMASHMLLQIPLLAIAGALLGHTMQSRLDPLVAVVDRSGIALALVAVLVSSYWMLPRSLDAALADPRVEAWKFLSLPLLVGLPARLCAARLSALAAGFVIANLLSMLAVAGWLYAAYPARLCNYYLLDQQIVAGNALLWIAGLSAVLWLVTFFVGTGTASHRANPAAARREDSARTAEGPEVYCQE